MLARIEKYEGVEPWCRAGVQSRSQRYPLGQTEAQERPMTVLIYVNTSKQVGDPDHLKVFANQDPRKLGSRRTIPNRADRKYHRVMKRSY